jgi:hypothetical protein
LASNKNLLALANRWWRLPFSCMFVCLVFISHV